MKRYAILLMLPLFFLACENECCDCDDNLTPVTQRNLKLVRNWGGLWEGIEKPQELDVYFYNSLYSLKYQKTYNDTTFLSMNSGEYSVLAVNNTPDVSFSGMESYRTAKVTLPVWYRGSEAVTTEVPLTLATYSSVHVDEERESECIVSPVPVIKVIHFRFVIVTDSLTGGVHRCEARLAGVVTSRMLCHDTELEKPATLEFTTTRKSGNIFDKTVSILGFSSQENNLLHILVECRDGTRKETGIDLSGLFDFETTPIQNCVVELYVGTHQTGAVIRDITISEWAPGSDLEIHIQ